MFFPGGMGDGRNLCRKREAPTAAGKKLQTALQVYVVVYGIYSVFSLFALSGSSVMMDLMCVIFLHVANNTLDHNWVPMMIFMNFMTLARYINIIMTQVQRGIPLFHPMLRMQNGTLLFGIGLYIVGKSVLIQAYKEYKAIGSGLPEQAAGYQALGGNAPAPGNRPEHQGGNFQPFGGRGVALA